MTKAPLRALLLALALGALPAAGQDTATASTAPKKPIPAGFERVSGAREQDKINPNPLVAIAYAAFFVCMFGYVVHIARTQTSIAKEMAELAARLKEKEKRSA